MDRGLLGEPEVRMVCKGPWPGFDASPVAIEEIVLIFIYDKALSSLPGNLHCLDKSIVQICSAPCVKEDDLHI